MKQSLRGLLVSSLLLSRSSFFCLMENLASFQNSCNVMFSLLLHVFIFCIFIWEESFNNIKFPFHYGILLSGALISKNNVHYSCKTTSVSPKMTFIYINAWNRYDSQADWMAKISFAKMKLFNFISFHRNRFITSQALPWFSVVWWCQ